LNESDSVAEPENLSEESEAEDLVSSQLDRENVQDAQDDQPTDFHSTINVATINEIATKP
jgi:hypothetical protein